MSKMLDALEKQKRDAQYCKTFMQMNQDFSSIREKIFNANKTIADYNITGVIIQFINNKFSKENLLH